MARQHTPQIRNPRSQNRIHNSKVASIRPPDIELIHRQAQMLRGLALRHPTLQDPINSQFRTIRNRRIRHQYLDGEIVRLLGAIQVATEPDVGAPARAQLVGDLVPPVENIAEVGGVVAAGFVVVDVFEAEGRAIDA